MEHFKRSASVATKSSETDLVVLHTVTGNYYTLNQTGRDIWEFCAAPRSADEIIAFIASEYGLSAEQIRKDIVPYLQFLCQEKLLEKQTPD